MKALKAIKKFRGLTIDLLSIYASKFDGYGFNLLQIAWSYKGKICTMSSNASLLFIRLSNYYNDGGMERRLYAGILFMSFKIVHIQVIPKKDRCIYCEELCDTKEFYKDGKAYCSGFCQEIDE